MRGMSAVNMYIYTHAHTHIYKYLYIYLYKYVYIHYITERRENGRNITSFRAWPLWPATWVG